MTKYRIIHHYNKFRYEELGATIDFEAQPVELKNDIFIKPQTAVRREVWVGNDSLFDSVKECEEAIRSLKNHGQVVKEIEI